MKRWNGVLAAGLVGLSGCCTVFNICPVPPKEEKVLGSAMTAAAGVRSEAEQWGRRVKAEFDPRSKKYQTAYTKYIEAKAATDGWVDLLKREASRQRSLTESPDYQPSLEKASQKADAFLDYARGLYTFQTTKVSYPPDGAAAVAGPILIDLGKWFLNERQKRHKEGIEELKKQLDGLKWTSFDTL
jgi:hypothetical protein